VAQLIIVLQLSGFWVPGSGFWVRGWRALCNADHVASARKPEDFDAWQLSWQLKERVFAFTETGPASRDFKFRNAIREAACSGPDNIAEGFYRFAPREFNHFLNFTRGSLGEVRNQLLHARNEKFLDEVAFAEAFRLVNRAIGATTRLQEYLQTCPGFFERKPPKRRRKPKPPDTKEPDPEAIQ
jgi:four helix bundle protein